MKYPLLVAQREYIENASTKGFWIGILLFPVIAFLSIKAPAYLEKSVPTRNFVVVDGSGLFSDAIDKAFAERNGRETISALLEYIWKHRDPEVIGKETAKLAEGGGAPAPAAGPDLASLEEGSEASDDVLRRLLERLAPNLPLDRLDAGTVEAVIAHARNFGLVAKDAPPFEAPRPRFRRVPLPEGLDANAPLAELASSLKPWVAGDRRMRFQDDDVDLFAAVLIPADIEDATKRKGLAALREPSRIEYWSANLADTDVRREVERAVNDEIRRREYVARSLDLAEIRDVQSLSAPIVALDPKKTAGEEEVSLADKIRQYAPVAFVYMLWIGIFAVSQMLLNNTIEEKSNRIIEVLLSSVTSGELMMGKLLGIAAIGLTMMTSWILFLLLILKLQSGGATEFAGAILDVLESSGLLWWFLAYFVLGYLMYAGLFLAVGSLCNTLKEAQNLVAPMTIVMMVPLLTMMFIPKDPNGVLARVLSWIPLYTPFIMMNRAAADPPAIDIYGTLALLALSTALVLWLSGRVFRIGILRTGQPPKLLEVLRWVRQ